MLRRILAIVAALTAAPAFAQTAADQLADRSPGVQVAAMTTSQASLAPGHRLAGKLMPCHVPGVDEGVFCGQYEVYENRAARRGRRIGLKIVVLPAEGPNVAGDPLVFLAGGGVVPATTYAPFLNRAFPNLRREHDVLLIDQRGSGGSNPLQCDLSTDPTSPEYRDDARFLAAVRRCRTALEHKADLRFYTTPLAMDDLDDVRGWLGYRRIDIFGVSYGTTAAMVYIRQHREHVRTAVLQGVLPLDVPVWLEFPRSSEQALNHVFAACARQPGCHDAFPEFESELRSLAQRLAERPVKVEVSTSDTGPKVAITIDAEVLRDFVSKSLFSASRIHDFPLLVHLAYQGDYQPLANRVAPNVDTSIPRGVYLSIVCNEQMNFDPTALSAATAGTFTGGLRVGRDIAACGEWPRAKLPPGFWTPVKSDLPILVLNGALDHLTPPRYGEHVVQALANARHLVLPDRGHNDIDPCVCGIIENFIIAGRLEGLDTSCLAQSDDLSFALQREQLAE